jgi:hypothetical protein
MNERRETFGIGERNELWKLLLILLPFLFLILLFPCFPEGETWERSKKAHSKEKKKEREAERGEHPSCFYSTERLGR